MDTPRVRENLAEHLIRRAIEQGAFENLPGAGLPIADLDQPYEENWWLRKWLKREEIQIAFPTVETMAYKAVLEKQIESVWSMKYEADVRCRVAEINARIRLLESRGSSEADALTVMDADEVVKEWRARTMNFQVGH